MPSRKAPKQTEDGTLVANNESRRDAAKRKLERQLVARAERAKRNRRRGIAIGAVVLLLAAGGTTWFLTRPASTTAADDDGQPQLADPCSYVTEGVAPAVREVERPGNGSPLNEGTVDVELTLNGTAVPITLDRYSAPCGVNAFLSLADQGFYDDTDCWRLTAHPDLKILQCGDPSGQGNGGPGFGYESETPEEGATYPRGTVALANAGTPNSTGSQFFIVQDDSQPVSPSYSIIGTIAEENMGPIDAIAEQGVTGGALSGRPIGAAHIDSITVPDDALEGTGNYPDPAESPVVGGSDLSGLEGLDLGELGELQSIAPTG